MGIKKTETIDFAKTINGQRRLKLENIICLSTCNPDDADSSVVFPQLYKRITSR